MKKRNNEKSIWKRLAFTALVLVLYMGGRYLPLYSVDLNWYRRLSVGAEHFLGMTIGIDTYKTSVFALGLSPYMIASILIMMYMSIRRVTTRSKFSYKQTEKIMYVLSFFLAVYQAILLTSEMQFLPSVLPPLLVRGIAAVEMIAGAMVIVAMTNLNKEHGISGQSALIVVNILSGMAAMTSGFPLQKLILPGICSAVALAVTLVMENAEFRIPVQRVFIRNLYKDENYIAIKYNPIGVMPVMFATSIFLFIQQAMVAGRYLLRDLRDAVSVEAGKSTFQLTQPAGVAVYLLIVCLFTLTFSMILIAPGDMSEQLAKNNDSLCNICAGKPTRRYLTGVVLGIGLLSATVMSLCVGIALMLELSGRVDASLVMLPSMVMMLTSIAVNLWRELKSAVRFESYRIFL